VQRSATKELAVPVDIISTYEGMSAHRATATLRLDRWTD
jgi:sulfopropanediol 3-dehydrogenase